ncbi:hypothetical protein C8R44DRAFT_890336 [Mycena epipterygia]|nr:hypothetical protein C8R44DRAFT_890336 [Mycena epipterygia]
MTRTSLLVVEDLVAFLARSACPLTRLSIGARLDEEDLLKILASLPSPDNRPTEAQLLAMAASRRPILRSLRIEGQVLSQESVDTLREGGLEIVLL